ncbi:unnamed protein product [Sphenostylis stenocarpa]|uniref:Uncharacterized protein n=1 Tax=Sphenostylis stenocarpa TaxID=92480 RepID=A0AA86V9M5_9FABA|nr:unnamed protein product [Sphenostylis stenocarpa]
MNNADVNSISFESITLGLKHGQPISDKVVGTTSRAEVATSKFDKENVLSKLRQSNVFTV